MPEKVNVRVNNLEKDILTLILKDMRICLLRILIFTIRLQAPHFILIVLKRLT